MQGEMAIMAIESEADYLIAFDIDDLYEEGEALLLDAERRGLEI